MELIFSRRRNLGSLALRTLMWSSWSHCGVITPENTVIEARMFAGVIERPLIDLLEETSKHSFKTITVPDDAAAIAFARAQVGKPYDWAGVVGLALRRDGWEAPDAWFCSELVEACAVAGGRRRFDQQARRVTPQHSWMVV